MISIGLAKFQFILALGLGILALVAPRLLSYIVAAYLIVVGLVGLGIVR